MEKKIINGDEYIVIPVMSGFRGTVLQEKIICIKREVLRELLNISCTVSVEDLKLNFNRGNK